MSNQTCKISPMLKEPELKFPTASPTNSPTTSPTTSQNTSLTTSPNQLCNNQKSKKRVRRQSEAQFDAIRLNDPPTQSNIRLNHPRKSKFRLCFNVLFLRSGIPRPNFYCDKEPLASRRSLRSSAPCNQEPLATRNLLKTWLFHLTFENCFFHI